MKKTLKFLFICSFFTSQVWQPSLYASPEPLMKYPTEEELRQVEELLNSLTPEELKELEELGKQLIETAEQEGRPLFGPAPADQGNVAPQPAVIKQEPKPTPKPIKEEVKESNIPKKQLSQLQKMLSDLVDTLGSIRQKAASDEKLGFILEPINTKLNSLSYYIRTIAYSKQTVRLMDKEFIPLKENLSKFSIAVDNIDNQLDVEDITIELSKKKTNRQFIIQQAQVTLKKFVDIITTTCDQQRLLPDLESFMNKFEPEALELRKKQETQEKEAAAQVKKLPTTNAGISSPYLPTKPETPQMNRPGGPQGQTGVRFGAPMGAPSGLTVKNASSGGQQGNSGHGGGSSGGNSSNQGGAKNEQKPATKKPEEKKKEDEIKDKQPTIDEQAQEIRNRLIALNRRVQAGQQSIQDFFDYLEKDPIEAPATEQRKMAQPLGDLTYETFRIKKTMEKWVDSIAKTAEWAEARAYKDDMQRTVDNVLVDFQGLANKVSNILLKPENKTQPRFISHKEELEDFQKIAKDISTVKIKPK